MLGICRSRRARRAVPLLVLLGIGGFFVAQQARKGSTGSPLVNAGGAVSQGGVRRDVPAVAVKPYVAPAPPPPPTTTTTRRRAPPTTPFVPARPLTTELHPAYKSLLRSYPYQPVRDNHGNFVNIILVRAAPGARDIALYEKYKNELLFIGISSFEDFPLPSVNPFSAKYPADKYVGMFPGFLHMMREPEKHFPPHVKLLLMSQSDFSLPSAPKHDYSVPRKWDFTYSGSDQDVRNDCVGWSSFAKNWSFAKEAMEVMCGEFGMTGVLVATKSKDGSKACTIPASCRGKMLQTTFLNQNEFFSYVKQSRFVFLPQIHDASPRVSTQALAHDVPVLMNQHISGGWKYLNEKTGEMFHDIEDFREKVQKIVKNADVPGYYEPQKWVTERYGDQHSAKRLCDWVKAEFSDRVKLPEGTTMLYPSGA